MLTEAFLLISGSKLKVKSSKTNLNTVKHLSLEVIKIETWVLGKQTRLRSENRVKGVETHVGGTMGERHMKVPSESGKFATALKPLERKCVRLHRDTNGTRDWDRRAQACVSRDSSGWMVGTVTVQPKQNGSTWIGRAVWIGHTLGKSRIPRRCKQKAQQVGVRLKA